jgi:hypothetical protein
MLKNQCQFFNISSATVADFHYAGIALLAFIMLSFAMLSSAMLRVFMVSVVAPNMTKTIVLFCYW